jgi:hypothetical protein
LNRRFRRLAGLAPRLDESRFRLDLFFRQKQFVAGHSSGRLRGFLHSLIGALGGCQLGGGLRFAGCRRLRLRFAFRQLRLHFRSAQLNEQLPFFDFTAAIDPHLLDIAGHAGVERDTQERQELAGQLDRSRHGFGYYGHEARPFQRRGSTECEEEKVKALHSTGLWDRWD